MRFSINGLGSNMRNPVQSIVINNIDLSYNEFPSFAFYTSKKEIRKLKKMKPTTFFKTTLKKQTLDSLISFVSPVKDTSIFESIPWMSGAIYNMDIVIGKDSIKYEMMNTFDPLPLEIINLINPYLPDSLRFTYGADLIKKTKDYHHYKDSIRDQKLSNNINIKDSNKLFHIKDKFYKGPDGHLYYRNFYMNGEDQSTATEYFDWDIPQDIDPITYKPLGWRYAKDTNYIYIVSISDGSLLIGKMDSADVKTFTVLDDGPNYGIAKG